MIKTYLATIFSVCLTACVSTYNEPSKKSAHATVEFEKGYKSGLGFGRGTAQEYLRVYDDACLNSVRLAYLTWATGKVSSKRVAAGKRIDIAVRKIDMISQPSRDPAFAAELATYHSCATRVSFTPKEGRTYRIVNRENSDGVCQVEVTDKVTDMSPSDLQLEDGFTCP